MGHRPRLVAPRNETRRIRVRPEQWQQVKGILAFIRGKQHVLRPWPNQRHAYRTQGYLVPVLGGEPRRILPNAEGLTWIDPEHILFSEIKTGIHMAVVTATQSRTDSRDVYVPPRERGMAHRSALSPDPKMGSALGKWTTAAGSRPASSHLTAVLAAKPSVHRVPDVPTWLGRPTERGCTSILIQGAAFISAVSTTSISRSLAGSALAHHASRWVFGFRSVRGSATAFPATSHESLLLRSTSLS